MQNRREFLKTMAAAAALIAVPSLLGAKEPQGATRVAKKSKQSAIELGERPIILFQGDSITDAGRGKSPEQEARFNSADALGRGYAFLAAAKVLDRYASLQPTIYNRGISGNKVYQLRDRWQADCIELKPDVLSILIGVNDFWHMYNKKYDGTLEIYQNDLRELLVRTKKELPNIKLIIGEPFAVNGVKAVKDDWFPEFDRYRAAARSLATEFDAIFIPYQEIFDQACKVAPASWWTGDGVHPSVAGAELMATAWLEAIK